MAQEFKSREEAQDHIDQKTEECAHKYCPLKCDLCSPATCMSFDIPNIVGPVFGGKYKIWYDPCCSSPLITGRIVHEEE